MYNIYFGRNEKVKDEALMKNYDNSSNPTNESFDHLQLPDFGYDLTPWSNIIFSKVEKVKRFRKIRVNAAPMYFKNSLLTKTSVNYKI